MKFTKIKDHSQITDSEFEQSFEDFSFPPRLFNHEAHLRLAWIHIERYGVEKAVENVTGQIRRYAENLGIFDKYHHTLTIASVRAVHHFRERSATTDFAGFIAAFPRLNTNFRELIAQHYDFDLMKSADARIRFIPPNLQPF